MLTTLANGGAPSGQICPSSTIEFSIKSIIRITFRGFVICYIFCLIHNY